MGFIVATKDKLVTGLPGGRQPAVGAERSGTDAFGG